LWAKVVAVLQLVPLQAIPAAIPHLRMAVVDEVVHIVQVGTQLITQQAVEDLQFVYLVQQLI
jgi:hypothetical protein